MWVVKLGGSLAYTAELPRWLQALAGLPVVIVPGGGPFADTVRTVQQRVGFPDRAAHDMAILAMQQYGRMLASLAGDIGSFGQTAAPRRLPAIWLPAPESLQDRDIPASWEVTSDSLALWLATALGASDLLLVKGGWGTAEDSTPGEITMGELMRQNLIDGAFAGFAHNTTVVCRICGSRDHQRAAESISGCTGRLTRIRP